MCARCISEFWTFEWQFLIKIQTIIKKMVNFGHSWQYWLSPNYWGALNRQNTVSQTSQLGDKQFRAFMMCDFYEFPYYSMWSTYELQTSEVRSANCKLIACSQFMKIRLWSWYNQWFFFYKFKPIWKKSESEMYNNSNLLWNT